MCAKPNGFTCASICSIVRFILRKCTLELEGNKIKKLLATVMNLSSSANYNLEVFSRKQIQTAQVFTAPESFMDQVEFVTRQSNSGAHVCPLEWALIHTDKLCQNGGICVKCLLIRLATCEQT